MQRNVRRVWTQPERDEIPSGGTEIHSICLNIHQHVYLSVYPWSLSSANLFLALTQMQIYCYDPDDFQSLDDAIREGGRIAALAVLFEVGRPAPELQ